MRNLERRVYPRLNRQVALNVAANGYDFVTSTRNISCTGAYCTIDKYVPPFIKLMIKLNLPITQNGVLKNCDVNCQGVIVRAEDNADGKFNIAIFFNKVNDQPRQKIAQYLKQFTN